MFRNKWISLNVWLELIKVCDHDGIDKLDKARLKRVLINKKYYEISLNLRFINENGYHHQNKDIKLGDKSQSVDAVFVAEPGTLPGMVHIINWHL